MPSRTPSYRLTMRGRVVLVAAALVALVLGVAGIGALARAVTPAAATPAPVAVSPAAAASAPAPSSAPPAATATPVATTPTPTASRPASSATSASTAAPATPKPSTAAPSAASTKSPTTGMAASGQFTTASLVKPNAAPAKRVVTYRVLVETTVPVKADDAAAIIQRILDDKRGWASTGVAFSLVGQGSAELTIHLAAPATVDRMCAPMKTYGTWSCQAAKALILNADRWLTMTPTYDNIDEYRAYMVNHEMGHYLGRGHAVCPAKGATAPVMLQQSMGLGGCVRNAWPAVSGGR